MQIDIPDDSEAFVKARAHAAGYQDVRDYVLSLILEDDASQIDVARLERLAVEGLESGDGGTLSSEDWQAMRSDLESRIASRQQS